MARGLRVILAGTGTAAGRALAAALHGEGARIEATALGGGGPAAGLEAWFAAALARLGGLDLLVNVADAAQPRGAHVEALAPAAWDRALGANLSWPFRCARLAVPALRAAGGSIVNVAPSAEGAAGTVGRYGLMGLTEALARELAPWGVRVNTLVPEPPGPSRRQAAAQRAEELARAVAYLASPLGAHITGQHLGVRRVVRQKG